MNTIFSEFRPAVALASYIQTYWQADFNFQDEKEFSQVVLPNGCIELIIHTDNDRCFLQKGKKGDDWTSTPEFALVGLFDNPYTVRFNRPVKVFGVRFYPDGIRNVFGVPPSEFLATFEDGGSVLGKQLHDVCDRLRAMKSVDLQVRCMDEFITAQLSANRSAYDYTHLAMRLIRNTQGIMGYQDLLQQIPISPRQLQREFKSLYGITVTDYMRLSRMNAIQRYMLSKSVNLTDLPYDLKFSDQSHFINEFKKFAGLAPKKFLKNRGQFIVNPGNILHESRAA